MRQCVKCGTWQLMSMGLEMVMGGNLAWICWLSMERKCCWQNWQVWNVDRKGFFCNLFKYVWSDFCVELSFCRSVSMFLCFCVSHQLEIRICATWILAGRHRSLLWTQRILVRYSRSPRLPSFHCDLQISISYFMCPQHPLFSCQSSILMVNMNSLKMGNKFELMT